jgi:hypothetical protein
VDLHKLGILPSYVENCQLSEMYHILFICSLFNGEPGSSVSMVSGYGLDARAIEIRSPAEMKAFPIASVFRQALEPTQPPVQ